MWLYAGARCGADRVASYNVTLASPDDVAGTRSLLRDKSPQAGIYSDMMHVGKPRTLGQSTYIP